MSNIKSLLQQTAVYGLSSIVVRMINWVLTPIYTQFIFKKELGIHAEFMAMVAVLNVIYMLGMETSFFRFSRDHEKKTVFGTSQSLVFLNSFFISALFAILAAPICNFLQYPGKEIYIYLIAATLFVENICNIPFANLRYENKATQFVVLKICNIIICMGLNVFFLKFVYIRDEQSSAISSDAVVWILIANLVPWALTFLYFLKSIIKNFSIQKRNLWKEMILYSLPMTIVGLAGMINETLDRVMLKNLLPYSLKKNLEEVAIYNVNYKLAIIITLVIQAFRMGAEPFFFKISKDKNATQTYAIVMDFFIIACCTIMVMTNLNRELIASVNEGSYIEGIRILPIILLANVFLGIYYNLSVWFKLGNFTHYGAIISCIGAVITLLTNWYLIPVVGYVGSALAHLLCYFSMTAISFIWGQRIYPIPYHTTYNLIWIIGSVIYSSCIFWFFQGNHGALMATSVLFFLVSAYFSYQRYRKLRTEFV